MIIQQISSHLEWETLESEWDKLLLNSSNPNFFLSWTWLTTWWKYFARGELVVLVAREEDKIIGLAPLMICRSRRMPLCRVLCFIGRDYGFPAHMGFIAAKGEEARINEAFCRWLYQQKWDILILERMSPASWTPVFIDANFRRFEAAEESGAAKKLALPGNWEGLRFLKPKLAKRLRQYRRRLEREGEVKVLLAGRDISFAEATTSLVALNIRKWGGSSAAFVNSQQISFNRELIERLQDNCLLFVIALNGKHIAAKFDYIFGDTLYCNQGGWDPAYEKFNLGSICLDVAAEEATKRGLRYYDFLAGQAEYKDRWGTEERELITCVVPRNNLVGVSYKIGKNIKTAIQERKNATV